MRVTSVGMFSPVNYQTPKAAIFDFEFMTAIKNDVEKFDNHIERDGFFSFKTGKGIVFIGRLVKQRELRGTVFYKFTVDNITLSKRLERVLNESSHVSASRQDKE